MGPGREFFKKLGSDTNIFHVDVETCSDKVDLESCVAMCLEDLACTHVNLTTGSCQVTRNTSDITVLAPLQDDPSMCVKSSDYQHQTKFSSKGIRILSVIPNAIQLITGDNAIVVGNLAFVGRAGHFGRFDIFQT